MKILFSIFSIFYLWEHKQSLVKKWNWQGNRNLIIFDLLTSPKGHQFDPMMIILLAFCSNRHPRRCDMPHGHVWKDKLTPPPPWASPACPKVPPLEHDNGDRIKIPSDMFCIFHLYNTHTKSGIIFFEIDMLTEIKWYLTFDLTQCHQFDPRIKILLAFCSARHPRRFDMPHDHVWKKKFLTPWAPPAPQSLTPWAWHRQQNENPVLYGFFYLSFVRTNTKFGIKIFEIDFAIEIQWYLTFWPLHRAQWGGAKKCRCTPHLCE